MSSFDDFATEDRRLVVLRLLSESNAATANEYLLQSALEQYGHSVGQDRLRADLAWLAEQGLVTVAQPGGVHVATLTPRGDDVAHGRARVPGVKRPRAGA